MNDGQRSSAMSARRRLRTLAAGPLSSLARIGLQLAGRGKFRPDFGAAERSLLKLSKLSTGTAAVGTNKLQSLRSYFRNAAHRPQFFADPQTLAALAQQVAAVYPQWRERTLEQVKLDRIEGLPIYSRRGPVLRAGFPWGTLESGPGGDVLYAVRPHRFAFAPRWARAILYGEPLAPEMRLIVEDWMRFAAGADNDLAYHSNLVVVQRVLASSWAWAYLSACDTVDDDHLRLELRLLQILASDLRFLRPRLGHSYPNNHLLVDRFAGWYMRAVWPELVPRARSREHEEGVWIAEWERQTLTDGAGFEHAQHYHEFGCEMAIAYLRLCRRNGWPLAPHAIERTKAMLQFQTDANGPGTSPLAFGNAIEDSLFPLDADEGWASAALHEVFRSWFEPAAAAAPIARADCERAFWLLGGELADSAVTPSEAPAQCVVYRDGGLVVLPDSDPRTRLILRTGPALGRPLSAGHAHADLLSIYLSVDETPLIVDAGTYTYRRHGTQWPEAEPLWRRYFSGPRAHNGLAVGDEDPLTVLDGDFREPDMPARVELVRCHANGPLRWIEGTLHATGPYGGYRRGVIHLCDGYWLIYDVVPPLPQALQASLGFQAAPEAAVDQTASRTVLLTVGAARVELTHGLSVALPTILRGQYDPPAGWVSTRYGCKVPAAQLRYEWTGQRALAFVLTAKNRPRPLQVEAAVIDGGGCAFRLQFENRTDYLLASDRSTIASWRAFGFGFCGALLWLSQSEAKPDRFRWLAGSSLESAALRLRSRTTLAQLGGSFGAMGVVFDDGMQPEVETELKNDMRNSK